MDERFRSLVVLGVGPDATAEEIKSVYRELVREWHPDKHGADPLKRRAAESRLREINQAYACLTSDTGHAQAIKNPARARRPAEPGYDPIGWKESVAEQGRTEGWEQADEEFYGRALRLYLEGRNHFEGARWRDAVSCLLQSVYMVQENAEAYRLLGRTYRRLLLPAKAESAYKQALRICPDSAETVYELGEIYVLLKDEVSASRQVEALQQIDQELAELLRNSIRSMTLVNA